MVISWGAVEGLDEKGFGVEWGGGLPDQSRELKERSCCDYELRRSCIKGQQVS